MARGVRCVFKYPVARLKSSQLPPPNVGVSIQLVTAGEERGAGTGGGARVRRYSALAGKDRGWTPGVSTDRSGR
jgi:hypothetical protein